MFGKRSVIGEARAPAPAAPVAAAAAAAAVAAAPAAPKVEPQKPGTGAAMETGRTPFPSDGLGAALVPAPSPTRQPSAHTMVPTAVDSRRSEAYYTTKSTIFGALIEAIDLAQLARLDADSAREEIRDIVNEIISIKNIVMSISEQEELLDDICNDVLGFGPLEPLL